MCPPFTLFGKLVCFIHKEMYLISVSLFSSLVFLKQFIWKSKLKHTRDLPSSGSLLKWPHWPRAGLGHDRCQELLSGLPCCCRGSTTWAICHCFPRCISSELDRQPCIQYSNWHTHVAVWATALVLPEKFSLLHNSSGFSCIFHIFYWIYKKAPILGYKSSDIDIQSSFSNGFIF